MTKTQIIYFIILASEFWAFTVIWKVIRSAEYLLLKVALCLIALIPVAGPLAVLWITNFPPPQPQALMDQQRRSANVMLRWQDVFRESDPAKRRAKWRQVMEGRRAPHRDERSNND